MGKLNEDAVHKHLYEKGLAAVIVDPEDRLKAAKPEFGKELSEDDSPDFDLWKLLKRRAVDKLSGLHYVVSDGELIGTKVYLPVDHPRSMMLDLMGTHEDGLFVLELKVDRGAERHAFSELFAYSNYIAGLFPASGRKDILNVLVAPILNEITRQAYLYDLLISDRNIILYQPEFTNDTPESLRLSLYIPDDSEFQHFANRLLSHDAMSCAVLSFPDMPGWIECEQPGQGKSPPDYTLRTLERISSYAAQLMEREGLHGFCYMRKRWAEVQPAFGDDESALIVCAVNPFRFFDPERLAVVLNQLPEKHRTTFVESPQLGFDGRLSAVAKQAVKDCLGSVDTWLDFPYWGSFIHQGTEVVYAHNIGFRPTGLFREAYVEHLASIRRYNEAFPKYAIDVEHLQVADIVNWLRAWQFMEACGFIAGGDGDGTEDESASDSDKD